MNLHGEKFNELLKLYEETAKNLQIRALEKRSIFMYYKNKVKQRSILRRKNFNRMAEEKLGKTVKMESNHEDEILQPQDQKRT
jgi:UDP-2,3-diacylglucosamine pyrophosphatase LpxH